MIGEPIVLAVPVAIACMAACVRRARSIPVGRALGSSALGRWSLPVGAWRRREGPGSASGELHRLRAALAGGASLRGGLEVVAGAAGPWAAPVARVLARADAGQPIERSLDAWADESPDATVALLVDTLAMVGRTGGSYDRAIAVVASLVHDQEALGREIRSATSQARASALVLVAMPLAFAVLLAIIDERVRGFLFGSWLGLACLAAGLALDLVGAGWMRRVVGATP